MSGFRLTRQARQDLEDVWVYIAEDNVAAADRVVEDVQGALRLLAEFPNIGHARSDLADIPLRVWPLKSLLVIYRSDRDPIEVVRIVSGYRDLIALFSTDA